MYIYIYIHLICLVWFCTRTKSLEYHWYNLDVQVLGLLKIRKEMTSSSICWVLLRHQANALWRGYCLSLTYCVHTSRELKVVSHLCKRKISFKGCLYIYYIGIYMFTDCVPLDFAKIQNEWQWQPADTQNRIISIYSTNQWALKCLKVKWIYSSINISTQDWSTQVLSF